MGPWTMMGKVADVPQLSQWAVALHAPHEHVHLKESNLARPVPVEGHFFTYCSVSGCNNALHVLRCSC